MANYCTVQDVIRASGLDLNDLPKPMTENDLEANILDAQAEIDAMTNTTYQQTQTTETLDGTGDEIIFLTNYPLITVDTLTINSTSVTSGIFVYTGIEGSGKVVLGTDAQKTTFDASTPQLVSITYTHGFTSIPRIIKRATANVAARLTLAQQVGGTYNDLSTFQIAEFGGTIGQAYINIREAAKLLLEEWEKTIRPHLRILPEIA